MSPADVPPVIQAWVTQLLDPKFLAVVRAADDQGGSQLDVRLSSANGKVRVRPAIVVNGGGQAMTEPLEMLAALDRGPRYGQRQDA